jgi:hypothetical protein
VLRRYRAARSAAGTLTRFVELQDVTMSMIEKLQVVSITHDAVIAAE